MRLTIRARPGALLTPARIADTHPRMQRGILGVLLVAVLCGAPLRAAQRDPEIEVEIVPPPPPSDGRPVLSQAEIHPRARLKTVGSV